MDDTFPSASLTSLRAFDAVLRLGTLTAAAHELAVTPAAVSHRLRALEAEAGCPLVFRASGRFCPTADGSALAATLGDAFARIRASGPLLQGMSRAKALRVVAPMSFTVLWLLPRLAAFEAACPDVTPYVFAATDPLRSDGDPPHVRITHGPAAPVRGRWELLARDKTVVAHAPGLALNIADLAQARAVHIDSPDGLRSGTVGWDDWARLLGLTLHAPSGPHVSAEHAAIDLTLQGQAVMLASLFTSAGHFATGRLCAMPRTAVDAGIAYWISVERPGPVADAFRNWIFEAVAAHHSADMQVGLAQANA